MVNEKIVKPAQVTPELHHCNYISVPPGSSWGPRTIPDIELILIIGGKFSYEDSTVQSEFFSAGDMCLILPGHTHKFSCIDNGEEGESFFSCVHLELLGGRSFLNGDYVPQPWPQLKTTLNDPQPLVELFRQISDLWEFGENDNFDLLETLARAVWIYLSSNWHERISRDSMSPVIREMTAFLRQRFMEPVGREDLASRFNITPQYVNRLFKSELGITPTEYLNRYRIQQAGGLLTRSDMSIADVAIATGFNDQFYFSRTFKKYTGLSPINYFRSFPKK